MSIAQILFYLFMGSILYIATGGIVCMWKVIPYPDTLREAIVTAAKWPKYLFRSSPK